jgi:hypothetical protein
MSAKKSVFAKLRSAMLALGRSERTAARKARLLSSASFADFVRLTPEQNVKLRLSPKARHYALKGARITKATPTISARQFETKRTSELFGLSPETATQARQRGAISYASADQRERVAKAAIIGSRNDVIELRQFRRSTDGDFVRKARFATIEARACRRGLMLVDKTKSEGRGRAKQKANTHFPTPLEP